jgi:hypothetical protein
MITNQFLKKRATSFIHTQGSDSRTISRASVSVAKGESTCPWLFANRMFVHAGRAADPGAWLGVHVE